MALEEWEEMAEAVKSPSTSVSPLEEGRSQGRLAKAEEVLEASCKKFDDPTHAVDRDLVSLNI